MRGIGPLVALNEWSGRMAGQHVGVLAFTAGEVECQTLVDERLDQGAGIVRGEGPDFVLRDGARVTEPAAFRRGTRTTHEDGASHLAIAWTPARLAGRAHAFVGNGNLLANPHFVCYLDGAAGARLFALSSEPVCERVYSCFIAWKNGSCTIDEVVIGGERSPGAFRVSAIKLARDPGSGDIRDEVRFATFGQRLVKGGQAVFSDDLAAPEAFYDTRHLMLHPYYRGKYDFGLDQLLVSPALLRRAAGGQVVEFTVAIPGEPRVDADALRAALTDKEYVEGEPRDGERGRYRFAAGGRVLRMTTYRGLYPHNTIGVSRRDGRIRVQVTQFPGLSNRAGVPLPDIARQLAGPFGQEDALLLDNGGDVVMYRSRGNATAFVAGDAGYEALRESTESDRRKSLRMSSILLFAEHRAGALAFNRIALEALPRA